MPQQFAFWSWALDMRGGLAPSRKRGLVPKISPRGSGVPSVPLGLANVDPALSDHQDGALRPKIVRCGLIFFGLSMPHAIHFD
jgi:hypothetical protein